MQIVYKVFIVYKNINSVQIYSGRNRKKEKRASVFLRVEGEILNGETKVDFQMPYIILLLSII